MIVNRPSLGDFIPNKTSSTCICVALDLFL